MSTNGASAPGHPPPEEAEMRMRELIDVAGLAEPDGVTYLPESDELEFRWN